MSVLCDLIYSHTLTSILPNEVNGGSNLLIINRENVCRMARNDAQWVDPLIK